MHRDQAHPPPTPPLHPWPLTGSMICAVNYNDNRFGAVVSDAVHNFKYSRVQGSYYNTLKLITKAVKTDYITVLLLPKVALPYRSKAILDIG